MLTSWTKFCKKLFIYFPRLTPFGCSLLAPSDKRMTLLNKTSIPAQNSSPLEKTTSHVSINFITQVHLKEQLNLCTTATLGTPKKWPLFRGWPLFRVWSRILGKVIVGLVGQGISAGRCWQVSIVQRWPLAQVWLYSLYCLQRPPLGPEKSGRLTEVPAKTEI